MSGRRASLPGAAELFRSTRDGQDGPTAPGLAAPPEPVSQPEQSAPRDTSAAGSRSGHRAAQPARKGTGRQRHSSKITVYLSDEELLALEQARLSLRAEHQLGVDRGRIVREAVAVLLEDYETRGADSLLVRRLGMETGGE